MHKVWAHKCEPLFQYSKYNIVLGTVFMRKHGIVLDFELDQIRHCEQVLLALHEGTD